MRRESAGLCSRGRVDEEVRGCSQITRSEGGLGRRVLKEAGLRRGDATTAAKLIRRGGWEEGGSRREVAGVGRRDEKQWLERRRDADSR